MKGVTVLRAGPLAALALFFVGTALSAIGGPAYYALSPIIDISIPPLLFWAIFTAVHYAEDVAHRLGEPYGTLILTLAVTIIEVALIVSLMLSSNSSPTLPRDTVFSVVMIVCNGLVGFCILLGGIKYGELGFQVHGANSYLSILIALATLSLVMPNFTVTKAGPAYSVEQLVFLAAATILLYGTFLYIQTIRHQAYFIAEGNDGDEHETSEGSTGVSMAWMLVAVLSVVLLSKKFSSVVTHGLTSVGAPEALAGVIVALLVLSPESLAAIRAARRDQLQRSINIALGSALATIGLTVPAFAVFDIYLGRDLVLGLDGKGVVLLALTLITSTVTFGTGRTNILYGLVHLVLFATYVFLLFVP
jgi:Ca2+:H+ antiporter